MGDYFNYVLANLACVVFMGTVTFTLEKSGDKQSSTIYLLRMMRMLMLYFLSDSLWILFEGGIFTCNKLTMNLLTIVPYICLVITARLYYLYCEIAQGNTKILSPQEKLKTAIPFCCAIVILIIGLFTDYLFVIDETGYLEYRPLYAVLLMIPFGYLIYSSIKAFHRAFTSNRYYDHSLYIAMGLFPLTPIICGLIQAFSLTVPILCYGATSAVLFLYITSTENRISTDPLTQIYNRQEMQRYLASKMKSKPQGMDLYLLILDVDHFKEINDTYGHIEGDKALVRMAEAMKLSCADAKNRPFLSRFGGDEFIIIMEAESEEQVKEKGELIRENVTKLNEEAGAPYELKACVGYAKYDYDNPVNIPQLITMADEKLYEMKNRR